MRNRKQQKMIDELTEIVDYGDSDRAREFARRFAREFPPPQNLGYALGYLGRERMIRGLRLFGLKHPVFGDAKSAESAPSPLGQGTYKYGQWQAGEP